MPFTLSSAISLARQTLNDTDAEGYRYSDAQLVEIGNGALRSLATVKPEWLTATVDFTCATGYMQTLPAATVHSIVEVRRVKNGDMVRIADKPTLDAFMPGWPTQATGTAVNWMPDPSNPRKFFLNPPAANTQVLEVEVIRTPGPYTISEDTGLPETITEAVADYMVGVAEARNDEDVLSQRSAQFMAQFAARLGVKQG